MTEWGLFLQAGACANQVSPCINAVGALNSMSGLEQCHTCQCFALLNKRYYSKDSETDQKLFVDHDKRWMHQRATGQSLLDDWRNALDVADDGNSDGVINHSSHLSFSELNCGVMSWHDRQIQKNREMTGQSSATKSTASEIQDFHKATGRNEPSSLIRLSRSCSKWYWVVDNSSSRRKWWPEHHRILMYSFDGLPQLRPSHSSSRYTKKFGRPRSSPLSNQ